MMKHSLNLQLGQQMTMTPQLQQAIKLLQLSTLELQAQIQEALEENPMLEVEEELSSDSAEALSETQLNQDHAGEGNADERIPDELAVDSDWNDIYDIPTPHNGTPEGPIKEAYETQDLETESLQDHLLWQINLTNLTSLDHMIAMTIIDAVDEAGYLNQSIDEILGCAQRDSDENVEVGLDEIEAVLHLVQQLDPIGCASRDLGECLAIQLQHLDPSIPWLSEALALVTDHLDLLGSHDYKLLMRRLHINEDNLNEVVRLIQSLNPRPGSLIDSGKTEYIVPDVYVTRGENGWQADLNPDIAPKLKINSLYASFVKRADQSADNLYMRDHLQEARWFIKSLLSRNDTLLRVSRAIIERQSDFLDQGEVGMKPMVLRDIAEQLDMHESTISRVTTQKYMHTHRGIFELKYFFSSHVGTADGGECSATAIRAMIKTMVADENSSKPLSDNKIATLLKDKGINVARRTVAKYRESMKIPPSNERKRLTA